MDGRVVARRYVHLYRQNADGVSEPLTPTTHRPHPQTGCVCEYHRWCRSQCISADEMMPKPAVLATRPDFQLAARDVDLAVMDRQPKRIKRD